MSWPPAKPPAAPTPNRPRRRCRPIWPQRAPSRRAPQPACLSETTGFCQTPGRSAPGQHPKPTPAIHANRCRPRHLSETHGIGPAMSDLGQRHRPGHLSETRAPAKPRRPQPPPHPGPGTKRAKPLAPTRPICPKPALPRRSAPAAPGRPQAAVSTTRPVIFPARSRFSTASAFRSGSFATGMLAILPLRAIPISSRSSFTLPT